MTTVEEMRVTLKKNGFHVAAEVDPILDWMVEQGMLVRPLQTIGQKWASKIIMLGESGVFLNNPAFGINLILRDGFDDPELSGNLFRLFISAWIDKICSEECIKTHAELAMNKSSDIASGAKEERDRIIKILECHRNAAIPEAIEIPDYVRYLIQRIG